MTLSQRNMPNIDKTIQDESESTSDYDPLIRCLSYFGIDDPDLVFVPNLVNRIYESLREAQNYHWLDADWLSNQLADYSALRQLLIDAGRGEAPSRGNSNSPAHGYTATHPEATIMCDEFVKCSTALHVVRVLLLFSQTARGGQLVHSDQVLLNALRQALWGKTPSTVMALLAAPANENFVEEFVHATEKSSLSGSDGAVAQVLVSLVRAYQGNVQSEELRESEEITRGSRRPRGQKSARPIDSTAFGARSISTRGRTKRLGPKELDLRAQIYVGVETDGVPEPGVEIQAGRLVTDKKLSLSDVRADLDYQVRLSRHWLRHFGGGSPAHRNVLSQIERSRLIIESDKFLHSADNSLRACAMAQLVGYLTSMPPVEFLFNPFIFSDVFDRESAFFVNTVQISKSDGELTTDDETVRAILRRVRMQLPAFLALMIAPLKWTDTETFGEALEVTVSDYTKARKHYFRHLRDRGRYNYKEQGLLRQLQFKLDDSTGNSAIAYLLSGRSSDMHPVLLHYWGGSREQLESAYDVALQELLEL